jgi:hypothetical protein
MTKGEKWKNFFEHKGWIVDDVLKGGEGEKLVISIRCGAEAGSTRDTAIDSALLLKELDILCHETRTGTVFFQWDDILSVKLEIEGKKRGWL